MTLPLHSLHYIQAMLYLYVVLKSGHGRSTVSGFRCIHSAVSRFRGYNSMHQGLVALNEPYPISVATIKPPRIPRIEILPRVFSKKPRAVSLQ